MIKIIDGVRYSLDEKAMTAEVTTMWNGYEGDIIIPETVVFNDVTYRVTSIGDAAFYKCSSLTSIVIPESVKSIGEHAFGYCSSLTSIIIPDSVTSIGYSAFEYCSSLTSIVIPESVTSIGYETFYGCSSLISIVIPDGVTSIGNFAFCDCSYLTSIVIPDGVTSIGERAFWDCSSLKQDPTQEIEMSNFKYRLLMHNHLAMVLGYSGRSETINIPSEINHEGVIYRVTSIGSGAFENCSSLTSITFNGTKAQWKGIYLGYAWKDKVPAKVVHCTDGDEEI